MASEPTFKEITSECKRDGKLYEDPDFEATDDNLFYSRQPLHPFIWKRPKELRENPVFILDEATRYDVQQGKLGDSWLLNPISTVTMYPPIFHRVVPLDQDFDSKNYCGAFRFNFWFQGKWKEVVVDDRLPTYNGKLVFVHSENPDVFWSALFEKAYAKLYGSYEALKGGQTGEAIVDITGDVVEKVDLKNVTDNNQLLKRIQRAIMRSRLIGCSIDGPSQQMSSRLPNGLVKGLAYAVTAAKKVNIAGNYVNLVRVRNPWGNEREWTGDYGDKSDYWKQTSDAEKRKMGLVLKDDGEFWMSFKDFLENFTTLEIPIDTGDYLQIHHGAWMRGQSAGGSRDNSGAFHTNPQFRFELTEEQNVTLALMQKDRRKNKQKGQANLTIGFYIYKISLENPEYNEPRLSKLYLLSNEPHCHSHTFINSREIVDTFKLEKGTYFVIPSTLAFNEQGGFLLRIFTEESIDEDVKGHNAKPFVPAAPPPRKIGEPGTPEEDKTYDENFYKVFKELAGDDGTINAFELRGILTTACKKVVSAKGISLECCRSLINLYGTTQTGTLEYQEFKRVWQKVKDILKKFSEKDKDKNENFNAVELRSLLRDSRLTLTQETLDKLCGMNANESGYLGFEDVVNITVNMERLAGNYLKQRGETRKKQVEFNFTQFVEAALFQQ